MVKRFTPIEQNGLPSSTGNLKWWLWSILLLITIVAAKEFIQYDEDGEPELVPERAAKLARELKELESCEQYALLAAKDAWYPCYSCLGESRIFLNRGFVWKYGVTCKGEKGRYGQWHVDKGLLFHTQHEGPLQECLEKIKIYNYALHPENLARSVPLIRPPGNKQDN